METNKVQDHPDWWKDDERLHALPRVLRSGPEAMRKAARGGRYIFPNPGEQELVETSASIQSTAAIGESAGGTSISTQFDVRLERSDFAPYAWAESIESIARTPFRNSPQLDGWDEEIQGKDAGDGKREGGWVFAIDGKQSFHTWAQQRFENSLFDGIEFALADPDPRVFSSAAARRAAGARPRVRTYKRSDLWTFHRESEDGGEEIAAAVINRPDVTFRYTDPNAWTAARSEGYQVIIAPDRGANPSAEAGKVRSRVYVQRAESSDFEELPEMRRTMEPVSGHLSEVPLVPFYGQRVGYMRGHSPFLRTAWSQVAISNASSELQDFARELCLVIGFGAGWDFTDSPEKPLGGSGATRTGRFINAADKDATCELLQPNPDALAKVESWIQTRADAIRKAHRQLYSSQPRAPITAREVTLEAVYAGSQLELWVRLHEASWHRLLSFMAQLSGIEKVGSVGISHDFGLPSVGMEKLWDGYIQTGGIDVPASVVWPEAKRHGWIDEATSIKDLLEEVSSLRAAAEGAVLSGQG